MTLSFDAIVIGAGAAGLFFAGQAGMRGKRVAVIDHAQRPAEKVRISGGGRCNFTNIHTVPERFISQNPHFARSALARYTPTDFCAHLAAHGITWHEKTLGQLFCDGRSQAVVDMLVGDATETGTDLRLGTKVTGVTHADGLYTVATDKDSLTAPALVVASGGLSIPKIGASGFAYALARQFGHDVVETRPGLVPFTLEGAAKEASAALAGVALPVRAEASGQAFEEAALFTHRGLSGPALLQVSSYWRESTPVMLDLWGGRDAGALLRAYKEENPKKQLSSALDSLFPARLAGALTADGPLGLVPKDVATARLADLSHKRLDEVAAALSTFSLVPSGTEGYRTAEVTVGGIDTNGLSSKTMESRHAPGLFFIGEAVDVTGWLGGYNFQWAWASAQAAAEALAGS